ncbi:Hypothetical predicted protein [Paramuricea clavata]|uniref:Uncharacterized protein n=1 Tax=Paramuricea clavata TaxID=317549 RepID=A0A6S7I281_PARCT|nr:Hypothetical predicted protein [Paramuricea clavata]
MADENDKVLTNGSGTNHSTEDEELEEFQALDNELDQLDSCLSVLEGRNENLHSECVKVLERMKELRQQNTNGERT